MSYKVSRYNYITQNDNGDYLICNLICGPESLRIIPAASKGLVDSLSSGNAIIDDSTFPKAEKLKALGYLTDINTDESFIIDTLYNEKANNDFLKLIIMSTGQCNFRCKYCYEDFKKGTMSEETQRNVLKYIQKQLNHFTKISIDWFGGEPLIGINVIENIMKQVDKMCAVRKAYYTSTITTNAYLLTPDVFKKMYDLRVLNYQITLDGIKEQHDSQRVLINNEGTFDRIFSNLLYIRDNKCFSKANIAIRVNITQPIADHFSDFIQLFRQEFGKDTRFSLLFAQAGNYGGTRIAEFEDKLMSETDTCVNDLLKKQKLFDSADIDFNDAPTVLTPMSILCYASMKNSFVIDSEGMVYKCTVNFGDRCNQIGHVDKNGNMILDRYAHSLWYRKKNALSEMCRECKYLPVCYGGGCTYYANFNEPKDCCSKDLKNHVEDYMKYLARRMDLETV